MKRKHADDEVQLCEDCIEAFKVLKKDYHVDPEKAGTIANGVWMAMRGAQRAFQELAFELAIMTSLVSRAFQVLTGRNIDARLIGHMINMGMENAKRRRIVPPLNCTGAQIHVYSNVWLRLNELTGINAAEKSNEQLERRLLQELMNFYERGAFAQLEHKTDR